MVRSARLLLALALLAGMLPASRSYAQTADRPGTTTPAAAEPAATPEPEFLKTLPRPPDAPRSLLAPPPPLGPPPPDLERPYFQPDPLLDPPALGRLGRYGLVDVGILKPHLQNQLTNTVTFPDGSSTTVGLLAARLNWTASPRFELGYRLPSGFGGISLGYRFMVSEGTDPVVGADGPAVLKSRLDMHLADLDWTSREYTPWQFCDMRVRFGLRYVATYFDSQAFESRDEAAAGSGIFFARTTSGFVGIGPHAGLDLFRRLGFWGLAVDGHLDLSSALGRIRQNFFASTTTPGADGQPQDGRTVVPSTQALPIVNARAGLSWQPPAFPNVRLLAGYQFEYVWHAGQLTAITTTGVFWDSGAYLRAEFNY